MEVQNFIAYIVTSFVTKDYYDVTVMTAAFFLLWKPTEKIEQFGCCLTSSFVQIATVMSTDVGGSQNPRYFQLGKP